MSLRRAIAFALIVVLAQPLVLLSPAKFARAATIVCGVPGNDGAGGTLSAGVYNTYWAGAGTLPAGSTSVVLGTPDTSGGGSSTMPVVGDELLIIQMQDGTFNDSNSSAYGSAAGTGSGLISAGTAGLYEYVVVAAISGSTYTIQSTGSGEGLLNTYTAAAATPSTTGKTFQIVRVPEYTTATLSSSFRAAYWDGSTGGVAVLDVDSALTLNGATISAVGDGFRGGAFTYATTTPASVLNNDWVDSSQMNAPGVPGQGMKGEGILGTPDYVFEYTNFSAPAAPSGPSTPAPLGADGYPGGDMAMGAPGNAGGGGTDDDPAQNDENTGGGGGANGGAGGQGGYPWTPDYDGNDSEYSNPGVHTATGYSTTNTGNIGGRGGGSLASYAGPAQVFMGGGGGAGVNNNNSDNNTYNGYGSSGGVGGGIVLLRINTTTKGTGDATINANGTTGLAPLNDGGGGGGAGGTVVITSPAAFTDITVNALGAAGTTANATNSGGYSEQHGPGGGGGGGVVLSSSSVAATVTGGAAGTTTTMATTYGATAGATGTVNATIAASQIPGISSGAECSNLGDNTLYNGPVDTTAATDYGANETGSFDGTALTSNNDDFTARDLTLGTVGTVDNTGTSVTSPTGAALSLAAAPTASLPSMLYDDNTAYGNRATVTLTATAPTGWTVELCPDTGGGADHSTATAPSTADCGYPAATTTCKNSTQGEWITKPAAGATATLEFCVANGSAVNTAYWAVYTAPTSGLIPFTRYDIPIEAQDPSGAFNYTHNELYAEYVPLYKTASVVSTGCPPGVTPALPTADPTGAKVCHGGIIQYTVDYRNIIAGAGLGTEGANAAAFDETAAGSLVITDNGTLSTTSQTTISNWGTFTGGLTEALTAGLSNNTTCGTVANTCGDTTTGTTFTGNAIASKSFTVTIGGAAFRLYPMGFAGQIGQGTITFAVKVL